MLKNLFTAIGSIVIVILVIAVWWYLIFYPLPSFKRSPYEWLKSRVVSTYCNIRPNSETCINIEKRKKDSLEVKNYCDKQFPVTYEDFFPKDQENINYEAIENNQKCNCEYMKERGYNKDDDCRTFSEFLQDPLKKN